MRFAHLLPLCALAVSAGAGWAQTSQPCAAAPGRALIHTPLPRGGEIIDATADWQAANAAVAEFPRGHSDVVRWEAGARKPQARSAAAHEGHP